MLIDDIVTSGASLVSARLLLGGAGAATVTCYRLKGYWFHLIDPATKQFRQGTTLDMVRDRYEFDREIRALILVAVERLEVAIRTVICNFLSLKYSPHWYLDSKLFKPFANLGWARCCPKLKRE